MPYLNCEWVWESECVYACVYVCECECACILWSLLWAACSNRSIGKLKNVFFFRRCRFWYFYCMPRPRVDHAARSIWQISICQPCESFALQLTDWMMLHIRISTHEWRSRFEWISCHLIRLGAGSERLADTLNHKLLYTKCFPSVSNFNSKNHLQNYRLNLS